MIHQTREQSYERMARMKLRLDGPARIQHAREEGFELGFQIGLERGTFYGRILLLREMLGVSQPTEEELASLQILQLSEIEAELLRRWNSRPN